MTQAQQPEALRLADEMMKSMSEFALIPEAAAMLLSQRTCIAELEAAHLREVDAYRTTVENLKAERCAIIAEKDDYKISLRAARAELAALKAAPAAQAVEPAAGAAQSGTVTYSDGTTATGPGSLPQVSPRQQRAAALIDSVEALLGGANGPTIQLRALLAAPAPAAVAVPDPEAWRYTDARGHYRYRGMRPGFAVEYPMLKPEPLFTMQQVRVLLAATPQAQAQAFQQRVQPWMQECFGAEISADGRERNHRFLEESLELVQALGCTEHEARQLVAYVYGRPKGEPAQEVGGVMVTLAALCLAHSLDMHVAGDVELARIWTKVDAIRAKQAAKPKHSPLPMHAPQAQDVQRDAERYHYIRTGKHYAVKVGKDTVHCGGHSVSAKYGPALDSAIDAAIEASEAQKGNSQ